MMTAQTSTTIVALLERESRQLARGNNGGDEITSTSSPSRLNAVWRQKVIHWYFTLVAALRRQHLASESGGNDSSNNPFDRTSVHVTASLLDSYLMSLPSERALRYKHDRPAYQLLATTCLLLGLRLAQHDQIKEARQKQEEAADEPPSCGLKRAKTLKMNMNEEASVPTTSDESSSAAVTLPATRGVLIPNAATILRISAAPKSISEQHVLTMVREMTGSRSFPRTKVVTALDFIQALSGSSATVSDEKGVTLGPDETEEACLLVDASLRDVRFSGIPPSVLACSAITLSLARSGMANISMSSLREKVFISIYGDQSDPELQTSIRQAESHLIASLQVVAPASRNNARSLVPTTHLIPLEDD